MASPSENVISLFLNLKDTFELVMFRFSPIEGF